MSVLNKLKIKATEIYQDTFEWLQRTYSQEGSVFTPASPFGQIVAVLSNITEIILYYIEHSISELNFSKARNVESIYGLAQLTGHNAFRGNSAKGMLNLRVNTSADFDGDYVQINNKTKFSIEDNGLSYFINLKSDYIRLSKNNREFVPVEFIQGVIETQTFTSTGDSLMSFSALTNGTTDDELIVVKVNGEIWSKEESLYDMNANSKSYLIKTSVNGGINLFFGNGEFGAIPQEGATITLEYVKSDGFSGNLNSKIFNVKFEDFGYDYQGDDVDLNECISINVLTAPNFGSDPESKEFTRLLAPHASKSFVLATPDNYIHFLSKYDCFSFVDAYNTKDDQYISDDNVIYLNLIPNIKKKITDNYDYFNIPEEEFTLSKDEENNVLDILNKSGKQLATSEVIINKIQTKKYVINIIVKYFQQYNKKDLSVKIRSKLNEYFLNINRRDCIPKSDIISLVEHIDGIDGVNVFFVSEENETAIKNGFYTIEEKVWDDVRKMYTKTITTKYTLKEGENPNLGLDSFGDILIKNGEIAIIRGGFTDRNGVEYGDIPSDTNLGSLNIFFTSETPDDLYNKKQQDTFMKLLNN